MRHRATTTPASPRRIFRLRLLIPATVLVMLAALLGGLPARLVPTALGMAEASSPTTPIWSTQLDFDNNGTAWSESFFAGLAADGLTTAELNMPWGTIEPEAGTFTFTEFDAELANAAAAGIQLIPIFWQAGWGGSPAPWITDFEESSSGAAGAQPDWWNSTEQSEYFTYVEDTIQNAVNQPGGYGGAVLNYGYLDAMWDLNGSGGGYTADDISEFQNTYLPQTYGTIATFNSDNGTSYTSFSQVPAAAQGQALFGVFQAFRAWSVAQTYGALTADVRSITSTPLYYYFGGGFGNATNYANNPDTFFKLAKQYNVTIIDDDASSQGLTLTFGSLARAYGVKVAQEWTAPPSNSQLAAEAVQWISSYAMGLPEGGGEDFFIHDGTEKDIVGFPIYTADLPQLKALSGTYPQQPVAVYIDFSQGYGNTSGGSLNNVEGELGNLWLNYQSGFTVVTSQEVNNGAVSLSSFKAVLPLNGTDANLTAYQKAGGTLLTSPAELTQYSSAYATIDAPDVGNLQIVPAVASSGTSAALTLGNITSGTTYDAPVSVSPAGLDMASGSYHLVNAATGAAVPQTVQSSGLICATADINAATLAQWNVVAGAPPSGTASSTCPVTETGATTVSATAGQAGQGLTFLQVGTTNSGSDGNLTQITQGGETAYETWTSSQSGAGDANVYLQINPLSAVEAASSVTMQVTYWATAGQGFTVQYDTASNAYQNGPAVTSPGTGTWATATVQLTGAQFQEAQNDSADLRLNVANASVPLIVQSITMSVTGTSSAALTASPTSLSFGNQNTGTTSSAQAVTVTNPGSSAASVSSIGVTGAFSQTNNCGSSIAANGSCTVSVTFAPTSGGAQTGTLSVASNAPGSPLTVSLSGTGVTSTTNLALNQPITASSTASGYPATNANDGNTSSYWESLDGAAYPQTLAVNLGASYSLGSITLDLPPATDWTTRTETLSVLGSTNGTTYTTIVASAGYTFNPSTGNTVTIPIPSGTSDQYVELSFTANTGWSAAQVSEFEVFPGGGGGSTGPTGALTASPTSLSFGNEATGSDSTAQTVTVTNPNSSAVTISSLSTSSQFAQTNTCPSSLPADGSCTVSVKFEPTTTGAASGTLSVASSAPGSPLTVALSGTGTSTSTNLALNQPVTASSYTQTYVPANAVDGNTSTYWEATDGVWPSWITVNLQSVQTLGSVTIDLPPSSAWNTRTQTLSILGSANGSTYTTIVASATYTWNPATGNTVTIALPSGTSAQYVEFNFTANSVQNGAQASEIQIYG
jgi:hypothetical protein